MIVRTDDPHAEGVTLTAAQVVAEVYAAWGSTPPLNETQVWETARGVAAYLGTLPAGAGRHDVLQLVARAFGACGETAAARRLYALGTGLVRATVWNFTVPSPVWVLNLKPLATLCAKGLEFALYHGLNRILDSIADVWDCSHGQGVLGLRNVAFCARAVLDCPQSSPRLGRYGRELCRACVCKLERLAKERGWRTTPVVMNLEG